jgi:hypothetical protein
MRWLKMTEGGRDGGERREERKRGGATTYICQKESVWDFLLSGP